MCYAMQSRRSRRPATPSSCSAGWPRRWSDGRGGPTTSTSWSARMLPTTSSTRSRRGPPDPGLADLRAVDRYPGSALGHSSPLRRDLRAVSERPDYLPEHIREKLFHDPRVAEQDLKVDVKGRPVLLGGNVSSLQ